jgi:ribonuclease P protein component
MLNRRHRFHGYGSVRKVYQHGQSIRGSLISAKFVQRDSRRAYRIAVVVSRQVSKSAVKRNRIRRRLYEAVRLYESMLPDGVDLVITAYSDQLAAIEADKLQELVSQLLKKLPERSENTGQS